MRNSWFDETIDSIVMHSAARRVAGRGQVQVFGQRPGAKDGLTPKIGPGPDEINGLPGVLCIRTASERPLGWRQKRVDWGQWSLMTAGARRGDCLHLSITATQTRMARFVAASYVALAAGQSERGGSSGGNHSVQINLSVRHGHLSEASQETIVAKFEKLNRIFERLTAIEVTIDLQDEESPAVDVKASAEHKHDFVASNASPTLMAAVDAALHKMEQQLRKYKEKIQDHHR